MNLKYQLSFFLLIQGLYLVTSAQENGKKRLRNKNIQAQQPMVDYEEYYDENANGTDELLEEGM